MQARSDPEHPGFNEGFLTFRECMNFNTALLGKIKINRTMLLFVFKTSKEANKHLNICALRISEAVVKKWCAFGRLCTHFPQEGRYPSNASASTNLGAFKEAEAVIQPCHPPQKWSQTTPWWLEWGGGVFYMGFMQRCRYITWKILTAVSWVSRVH